MTQFLLAPAARYLRAFFGVVLAVLSSCGTGLYAQTIYALAGNNLLSFSADAPAALLSNVPVSGLSPGLMLAGLDFRPNTGELYALGYHQMTGEARLYTLDRSTGTATAVGGAAILLKPGLGKVGFDFNPTVDRIRVTGSNNANYRLHPVTGAVAATDLDLAFAAADVNAAANPSVGAVAYTNSYIGATATTLYNYDDSLNVLTTQIPPNNGTLNTVGASGFSVNPADPTSDLDIFFDAAAGVNRAFLAANTGTDVTDNLYTVNLVTGAATPAGSIGVAVNDIAVFIDRTVPGTIAGQGIWALTANNNLVSFDSALPGTLRSLVPVSGVAAGQALAGLDFRPATGELYALGYNATTGEARLYTLNAATGAATAIGPAPVMLKPAMGKVGMDFNPTVDRIRVTGSDNSNYRLHPVTGAVVATDQNLAFATADPNAGKDPAVGTVAYTNSFNGATATTLYNYDDSLNVLTTQIPPNNGTLNTVGASGLSVNPADPSSDLDIFYNPFSGANRAYLAANTGTSANDMLYTLDLGTGLATALGRIGYGIAVTDLAVSIQPVETACDVKTTACMKYEMLSVTKNAAGDKTYRIRVTNACADKLVYAAFRLPNGVTAEEPAHNSTYASPGGHSYEVRNPSFSPFYSVRFREMGSDGIAGGQMDIFEYTLPAFVDLKYLQVTSKTTAGTSQEAYLNVFSCTVGTQTADDPAAADRSEVPEDRAVRVFPNPSTGSVFADLSGWAGGQVQIRAFTAQGQEVLRYTVAGIDTEQIVFPDNAANGLYLLEFSAADGEPQLRRVLLQR